MAENQSVVRRATAKICPLKYLLTGTYIVQEGWQPNYVQVGKEQITRINILGLVVEKTTPNSFYVDDGTGSILVIDFSQTENTKNLSVGDPVLIVGRPRKSEEGLFIASEIVSSKQLLSEPEWLEKRQQELQNFPEPKTSTLSTNTEDEQEVVSSQLTGDDVVDFMKKKDTGEGCLIEDIVSYFGEDVEDVIHTLLSMGEVYEIKPGVLKVLE